MSRPSHLPEVVGGSLELGLCLFRASGGMAKRSEERALLRSLVALGLAVPAGTLHSVYHSKRLAWTSDAEGEGEAACFRRSWYWARAVEATYPLALAVRCTAGMTGRI